MASDTQPICFSSEISYGGTKIGEVFLAVGAQRVDFRDIPRQEDLSWLRHQMIHRCAESIKNWLVTKIAFEYELKSWAINLLRSPKESEHGRQ